VKDDRLVVRIAENTKIEVGKSFVSVVVNKAGADKK
jgi:preprotein translocase subunit YajC